MVGPQGVGGRGGEEEIMLFAEFFFLNSFQFDYYLNLINVKVIWQFLIHCNTFFINLINIFINI